MAEPTLQQVFGTNAAQDSTTITISKADLVSVGFTAAASNTAESLLVAIILKAQTYLNDTTQETNTDVQVTVSESSTSLVTRNNIRYRQASYSIELLKLDTTAAINPNDY
jgi:hypothetical protein